MEAVAERSASREMKAQPLEILNVSGAWLNVRTVELLVGFGKTKINADIKAGKFPQGKRFSQSCTRWLSDDILRYNKLRAAGQNWSPAPVVDAVQ